MKIWLVVRVDEEESGYHVVALFTKEDYAKGWLSAKAKYDPDNDRWIHRSEFAPDWLDEEEVSKDIWMLVSEDTIL